MITAFALIKGRPDRVADLAGELAELDGVYEAYSVTGDVDIVAIIRVRDHDQLADVMTMHVARLEGIVSTRTLLSFRVFRRKDIEASFGIGVDDPD
jgi:DNA-binding Lrp family transcriptional regulator